jgi:hypothetical protein
LKSDFYKAASPLHNGNRLYNIFSTQNNDLHTTLKRSIGSLYTKSATLQLEAQMDRTIVMFLKKISEFTKRGPATIDLSVWVHLYAFDSLGDISNSKSFGFLESGHDVNGMIRTVDRIYHMTGLVRSEFH